MTSNYTAERFLRRTTSIDTLTFMVHAVRFSHHQLRRLSLAGIVLLSLSLSILLTVPTGTPSPSAPSRVGSSRRSDGRQELMAATASLEKGQGLLTPGRISCSNQSGSTYGEASSSRLSSSWTNITSPGPSPRVYASMVFDAADGYVILFGGDRTGYLADTWKFQGGSWTNITSLGSSPRNNVGMAYDAADGYVILFGGTDSTGRVLADVWKFSSSIIVQPPENVGLNPTLFYGLIGLLVVIIVAVAVLALRKRKKSTQPQD